MDRIIVRRSGPLEGEIRVNGAKNSVLKLMAATTLAPGTYRIHNVPPGEKVVQVVASPKLQVQPRTIEGIEQQARQISRNGVIPPSVGGIGPATPGNGVQIEVVQGEQTLDVALNRPDTD